MRKIKLTIIVVTSLLHVFHLCNGLTSLLWGCLRIKFSAAAEMLVASCLLTYQI